MNKELKDFFEKNKISYQDPITKEIRVPLVKEIKKIKPGGPKLIKKITDGDGDKIKGFQKIGENFKAYILQPKKEALNIPTKSNVEVESTSPDLEKLNNRN